MNFEAVPCVVKNAEGTPMYGLLIRPAVTQLQQQQQNVLTTTTVQSVVKESLVASTSSSSNFVVEDTTRTKTPNCNPVFIPAAAVQNFSTKFSSSCQENSSGISTNNNHNNTRGSSWCHELNPNTSTNDMSLSRSSMTSLQQQSTMSYNHHNQQQNSMMQMPNMNQTYQSQTNNFNTQQTSSVSNAGATSILSEGDFGNILDEMDASDINSFLKEISYEGHELIHLDSASLNASQLEIMDTIPSMSFAERLLQHNPTPSNNGRFVNRYNQQQVVTSSSCTPNNNRSYSYLPNEPSTSDFNDCMRNDRSQRSSFDEAPPLPYPPTTSSDNNNPQHQHHQQMSNSGCSTVQAVVSDRQVGFVAPVFPVPVANGNIQPPIMMDHRRMYADVGTPDSGIQSIGESPASYTQNSPVPAIIHQHASTSQNFYVNSPPPRLGAASAQLCEPLSVSTGGFVELSSCSDAEPSPLVLLPQLSSTSRPGQQQRRRPRSKATNARPRSRLLSGSGNRTPTTVELSQNFDDMPLLEPQDHNNSTSKRPLDAEVVPDEETSPTDPSQLIDKLLSTLAPEQLAQMSKVFEAKLRQHGLTNQEDQAAPADPQDPQPQQTNADEIGLVSPALVQETPATPVTAETTTPITPAAVVALPVPPKANAAAAKKLQDYRAKMRQKRESERLTRDIDQMCQRLDQYLIGREKITNPTVDLSIVKPKFIRLIDWDLVVKRNCCKVVASASNEGLLCDEISSAKHLHNNNNAESLASSMIANLEREASDDEEESMPVVSNGGGPNTQRRDSLKVKIRLDRVQSLDLTVDRELDEWDQLTKGCEKSGDICLPLKKRFKCNTRSGLVDASGSDDHCPSPRITTTILSLKKRRKKSRKNIWRRVINSASAGQENADEEPPKLQVQQTVDCWLDEVTSQQQLNSNWDHHTLPPLSPQQPASASRDCFDDESFSKSSSCDMINDEIVAITTTLNNQKRLNPGILRKCSGCGYWLRICRRAQDKDTTQMGEHLCKNCVTCRKNGQSAASSSSSPILCSPNIDTSIEETVHKNVATSSATIRLLPPKKKYVKCGLVNSMLVASSSKSSTLFPAIFCEPCPFQLPYNIWWQYVNQKEFYCRDPSVNFRRIRNNIYVDAKPATAPPCHPCNCEAGGSMMIDDGEVCGDNCLNRMMFTECTSGICPCGEGCSNRRFQKRRWAPGLEKFWTGSGKGFGVRCSKTIKAGSLICEYLGEVVTRLTFAERSRTWYKSCSRHYALNFDAGSVIDGYRCGSVARFVNHSCEPNCEVQKWVVNGQYRMGIFALKEIIPGRELTYNYNFRRFDNAAVENCLCDSVKCSGTVGGISKSPQKPVCYKNIISTEEDLLSCLEKNADLIHQSQVLLARNVRHVLDKMRHDGAEKTLLQMCRDSKKQSRSKRVVAASKIDKVVKFLRDLILRLPGKSNDIIKVGQKINQLTINNMASFINCLQQAKKTDDRVERILSILAPPSLLVIDDDVIDESSSSPLVGAYDPDDTSAMQLFMAEVKADQLAPRQLDKVRCVCGIFEDDGTMVQCDSCLYWLHGDCIMNQESDDLVVKLSQSAYCCEFCRKLSLNINCATKNIFRDVILKPQPDFCLPHCTYYRTLMRSGNRFQVRVGDCVYLKRDVDERHKKLLLEFNEQCVMTKNKRHCQKSIITTIANTEEYNDIDCRQEKFFKRQQLRIMRVERLFIGPQNVRFVFGSYFAHHYETFCEPSRRFYKNEVFVTPLYDTWPLDTVVGRCLVVDPNTYCKGRPIYPHFEEADVYICEYRVDKSQRLFDKSSAAKNRYPLCAQPYLFTTFDEKLKIVRDYTPFSDQIKQKSKNASVVKLNEVSIDREADSACIDGEKMKQLQRLTKIDRLDKVCREKFEN